MLAYSRGMNTDRVSEFEKYLKREINEAVKELKKFDNDDSRIHIQKLVLASLVDRFDYMIDNTILDNCREEMLVRKTLKAFKDKPMKENELLRVLVYGDDLQAVLDEKLKHRLNDIVLSDRHSLKLATLLELCTGKDINELKKAPRVNPATGEIFKQDYKHPTDRSSPTGICGYADWICCRRNGIVHGDGKNFTDKDVKRMKEEYNWDLSKRFRVELASIGIASNFYKQVCYLIKEKNEIRNNPLESS